MRARDYEDDNQVDAGEMQQAVIGEIHWQGDVDPLESRPQLINKVLPEIGCGLPIRHGGNFWKMQGRSDASTDGPHRTIGRVSSRHDLRRLYNDTLELMIWMMTPTPSIPARRACARASVCMTRSSPGIGWPCTRNSSTSTPST